MTKKSSKDSTQPLKKNNKNVKNNIRSTSTNANHQIKTTTSNTLNSNLMMKDAPVNATTTDNAKGPVTNQSKTFGGMSTNRSALLTILTLSLNSSAIYLSSRKKMKSSKRSSTIKSFSSLETPAVESQLKSPGSSTSTLRKSAKTIKSSACNPGDSL